MEENKRDVKVFLKHMLESIEKVEKYMKNVSKLEFMKSDQIQDSIIRRFEIMGEATKNIPLAFRKNYPEIEWKKVAGLRDVLIHQYFGVDLDVTWKIVTKDLPDLKKKVENILKEIERGERR